MKNSLSYYLTLFVIKLKGIKRSFSQSPIDYRKIRREDVHQPKGRFFRKYISQTFKVADSTITEISKGSSPDKLLLFIHGGAFISGPAKHHWDSIKEIAKKTNCKIWMCDYPKAPESTIDTISQNIDLIYDYALKEHPADQILLIGDSVGGNLVTSLAQRIIADGKPLPAKIILVSPVMDASMSNPDIESIEKLDPMLSRTGVLSAKRMCAGDRSLKDAMISPIYGSFNGFPPTLLFMGQYDIMYPDEKLLEVKLKQAEVELEVIEGVNMPHIWPFLPVMKEAKMALEQIVNSINLKKNIYQGEQSKKPLI